MIVPKSFTDNVAMKFRLYSGLFHDLPYEGARQAGTTLPLFAQFCREELAKAKRPQSIVQDFFENRLGIKDFSQIKDALFSFLRLSERQIVLFDAAEDAAYHLTRDMDGPGSLKEAAGRIAQQDLTAQASDLLNDLGVRIVLTAHPTQFYTEAVLGIISELREAIRSNDVQEVNRLLLQLGRTKFKKREKPSPYDEAKAILWFMENVLYEVVPQVHRSLLNIGNKDTACPGNHRPLVELGFWPGGDRDGNPNVTAATTLQVADLLRRSLIGLYQKDLANLKRRLTFDGVMEDLERINQRLESSRREDWSCEDPDPESPTGPYPEARVFLKDLQNLRQRLIQDHQGLFQEDLEELINRVACFGFHFGTLDLRQDSRVLARTMDALFQVNAPGFTYSTLTESQRMEKLSTLDTKTLAKSYTAVLQKLEDPVLRDSLEIFKTAAQIQKRNGPQSIHRFIVSNTRGPSDILGLRALAICAAMDPENPSLDLVPLFETVDDLSSAGQTMKVLWDHPQYREHLGARGSVQHIMLGFSDGTKDGGYLSANWGIYRAKQSLTALAQAYGIRLVFFDGRGGPPARGGGNTHKFYRSLGRDIEGRSLHLTIQGQTISSNYGNRHSARYNLEQLASAALDNYLYPQNEDWHLDDGESALLDELSQISLKAYTALRDHPQFMAYLEHLSPLRYYSQANNSSRPAKRPGGKALTLDDLRAIPFVGAWSQLKLNIPGYFGLGTALENLASAGRLDNLRGLYQGSLYFRTLLENSMQSLSKVYLPLTEWASSDPQFSELHRVIRQEADRTVKMLLAVSGQDELLAEDPVNRASIRMREDLITPISVVQQYALIHLRRLQGMETPPEDLSLPSRDDVGVLEKLVIKSMAASVNASRNSV